jgi:hypothetical protein
MSRGPRPMDCSVDAAPARKRCVRRVDDRVDSECGDVGDDDLEVRLAEAHQTLAWALTGTPASASIAASSPDWNISRVMSQPPTNSPLM